MAKKTIDFKIRPSASAEITKGVTGKDNCWVEVTEWANGEGYDIHFEDIPSIKHANISIDTYTFEKMVGCVEAINNYYNKLEREEVK